ncbi:MAG: FAD-binding oxidoreductase [Bacteroidia bacterium]|nr:FAD-binding oxidoreductase [Bacteroidia bacterium]
MSQSNQIHTEILIVGQGLAGSILSHQLIERGIDFFVIDKPGASQSSLISAGIWNPVVFKRMTSSWKAAEVIPFMRDFFTKAERTTGEKFVSHRKMLKYFTEEQEALLWKKKYPEGLSDFIEEKIYFPAEFDCDGLHKPEFGFSFVKESGNVDTKKFVETTSAYLKSNFASGKAANGIIEEEFDHSLLIQNENVFEYKNISCRKIIFSEGFLNSKNPFFNFIPFKPAKGELLTFHSAELKTEHIINKGVFILPLGNDFYKCGATYEWSDLSQEPTEKGQLELETKLKKIIRVPFAVTERKAGVRPSVIDRRPALGMHPKLKNHFIFNGFGTKAVMLAPYFANEMINFIAGKQQGLNPEIDIKRFSK